MQVVVLAAGKSTRFLPITNETPKALITIFNKPLVEYTLDLCLPHISEIIFVVNEKLGFKIKEYFGSQYKNVPIFYVVQKDSLTKGTFPALKTAASLIKGNLFAVCNCDDLYTKNDIDSVFIEHKIGIGLNHLSMPWFYNKIEVESGYIVSFKQNEKKEDLISGFFANGFYILSKEVFNFNPFLLKSGEVGLPQTLFSNIETYPLKAFVFSDWVPVNSPVDIDKAKEFIKKNYKHN